MRYKQFLLNEDLLKFSLSTYTQTHVPRVFNNIEAIDWYVDIKKTKYTINDDEVLRNKNVFYIKHKSQIRININSYYKEAQLVSNNIETFDVPYSGSIIDPEFINIPEKLLLSIQKNIQMKGQDFIYKIDISYSDGKVSPIILNRLPIYLWGKVVLEVGEDGI